MYNQLVLMNSALHVDYTVYATLLIAYIIIQVLETPQSAVKSEF